MTNSEIIELRTIELPGEQHVGSDGLWVLSSGDDTLRVAGKFLGMSTSYSQFHRHPGDRTAEQNEKCRACRWFEARLFRESNGGQRYLVHRTGRSIVPDEVTFTSHEWVRGPHEVVEALTTRPRNGDRTPYLTVPSARVLAQAASYDDELSQAYIDRAVA